MHRMLSVTVLLSSLALPLSAQGTDSAAGRHHHDDDDHHAIEGGGTVPAGWTVRADEKGSPKNVKLMTMGKGLHLTLGPAIIIYRAEDGGAGPFHTLATFRGSPLRLQPACRFSGWSRRPAAGLMTPSFSRVRR
jgi:hypothetical protein